MADGDQTLGVGYSVTLHRTFKAPAELVFGCFTTTDHLAKWWGPYGFDAPRTRADARPGGELFIEMRGPTYDSNPCLGEFVEVDRPNRLVFTLKAFPMDDGAFALQHRTTILFEPHGQTTAITLTTTVERSTPELAAALGGMKAGWGQSLEKLGDLVGGGGVMDMRIADKLIVLERPFDAPMDLVWRALTEPGLFVRWFAPGQDPKALAWDLKPDGDWKVETGPDGARHLFWGKFVAIEPTSRLSQTQGFDDHQPIEVETILTEEWGRTLLTRTMRFPSNAYRDGMAGSGLEAGASAGYDKLAEVLKAL